VGTSDHYPASRAAPSSIETLRQEIQSQRRNIEERLRNIVHEANRLRQWRLYLRTFPGAAVLTVAGLGLAIAAKTSGRKLIGEAGGWLLRTAGKLLSRRLAEELSRVWRAATATTASAPVVSAAEPANMILPLPRVFRSSQPCRESAHE
jgi:uracil-DNA glycosylase